MMKNKLFQICVILVACSQVTSYAQDYQSDDISDIPDVESDVEGYQSDDISDIPDVESDVEGYQSDDISDTSSITSDINSNFENLHANDVAEVEDTQEYADNSEGEFSDAEDSQIESQIKEPESDNSNETGVESLASEAINVEPQDMEALADVAAQEEIAAENAEFEISEVEIDPQDIFKQAYQQFKLKRWEIAAGSFLEFIQLTSSDEKNFEWAEFFMAISLEHLGYTHAAVDRFSNLAARKPNTKIVSYILDMFEQISRTKPFDYDQVILQVVNDKDYGFISDEVSGFVDYYQGIQDWKTGYRGWALDHFKRIPKDSYYYSRYLHQQALYQIEINKPKKALNILSQILQVENLDDKLRDESLWIAARLHYELGDMKEASFLYGKIKTPVIEQASFLLEQAWIEYQNKDYERAMGFLYAFEAPSFRQFFTPEYFLLKGFIYKDVCHYESALTVVEEFNQRYGQSLEAIYNRKDETDVESEELLYVILAKKNVKRVWTFITMLEEEKKRVDELDDDNLIKYVKGVYNLQIQDSSHQLRNLIKNEYASRANGLLQFEEESNLMRYEIGVDMYQRVAQNTYVGTNRKDKSKKDTQESQVVFSFQREYWNDELGFYKVSLPNKCDTFKDWDLFF